MIYVLLIFAHVGVFGKGNANSVTTQEFLSQASCENAKKVFVSMDAGSNSIKAECVKK